MRLSQNPTEDLYLQSLQQSEVLEGSSLYNTDLVVLQMPTGTHTEQDGQGTSAVVTVTSRTEEQTHENTEWVRESPTVQEGDITAAYFAAASASRTFQITKCGTTN